MTSNTHTVHYFYTNMAQGVIEAPARILSLHREGIYLAAMPNGKQITAFIPPKNRGFLPAELPGGTEVIVQMTIFDFSSGKILRLVDAG